MSSTFFPQAYTYTNTLVLLSITDAIIQIISFDHKYILIHNSKENTKTIIMDQEGKCKKENIAKRIKNS